MLSSLARRQNHSLICVAAVLIYHCVFFFPSLLPGYSRLYQSGFALSFSNLAFYIPCTLLLWRQYRRNYPFLPLGTFSFRYFFIGLAAIAALNFISHFVHVEEEWVTSLRNYPPAVKVGFIFAIGFAAPFCEEVIFRGFFLNASLGWGKIGRQSVIVVTSLCFALLHTQYQAPSTFIWLFIFSALLCVIRIASGGLLVPILLHMVSNMLSLAVVFGG